jgi:multidrug resistance efflux pump
MSTQTPPSRATQQPARSQVVERGELAVSTTSPDWDGRPHHRRMPRLTSLLLVLGLLAICALVAVTQITRRLADRDIVQVRQAVLTADPVAFNALRSGTVTEMRVKEGDSVTAGQVLAVVLYDDPSGQAAPAPSELQAPADGIISLVEATTGESIVGGGDLLTMYQPSEMFFEVPMTYKDAAKLRVGMKATLDVPGIGDVEGDVIGVQSDFGDAGEEDVERLAKVVVRPDDASEVIDAAPGIVTDGEIDKGTAPDGAPSVIFAER